MNLETLAERASHGIEVKHSRFLAQAAPVECPAAALAFFAEVGDSTATHNCWAYRIGSEYRFNDDGEIGGTAGRPILAAIEGQGLDRLAVVVTRWYGGIKLGAGGLVRAYGGVAAECLRTAARTPLVPTCEVHVDYPFADTGAIHAALPAHDAEKLDERFGANGAHLRLRLPVDRGDALVDHLRDATRGRARVRFEDA
ncbi:IMPACT family protein [Lysobacter sp. A3-1-A15]|uniref:IMPACT family protein n=1 Tax=Novilysobacter viscosus TaxID=3098602 RepID=UPI002ED936DC